MFVYISVSCLLFSQVTTVFIFPFIYSFDLFFDLFRHPTLDCVPMFPLWAIVVPIVIGLLVVAIAIIVLIKAILIYLVSALQLVAGVLRMMSKQPCLWCLLTVCTFTDCRTFVMCEQCSFLHGIELDPLCPLTVSIAFSSEPD